MPRRAHIWVRGRVQGVSFRASARKQALARGITGWARNLADGGVEILAEGSDAEVTAFIQWCGRGPLWARVEDLEVADELPKGEFSGFQIIR